MEGRDPQERLARQVSSEMTEPLEPLDPQGLKDRLGLRVQQEEQDLPERQEPPVLTETMEQPDLLDLREQRAARDRQAHREAPDQRDQRDPKGWYGRVIGPPLLLMLWMTRSTIQQTVNPICANRLIPQVVQSYQPIPRIGTH